MLPADVDRGNIHVDKVSRAKASRPKLGRALQLLREGDTLTAVRLDRSPAPLCIWRHSAPVYVSPASFEGAEVRG
ncbi:hypothetical protein ACIHCQ_33255 [Streptomyces sp. NPDC052236]|uniref:hypothetical protein n=1 Tax=Streptomyces sp. NPDC052236 TaxID=3365686 RepID=UPI0037D5ADFD